MSNYAFGSHDPATAKVNEVERTASVKDGVCSFEAVLPVDPRTIRPSSFPLRAIAKRYGIDPSTVYCYADGMHPRFGDQQIGRSCWHLAAISEVGKIFAPIGEGHTTGRPGTFHDFHDEVAEVMRRLR